MRNRAFAGFCGLRYILNSSLFENSENNEADGMEAGEAEPSTQRHNDHQNFPGCVSIVAATIIGKSACHE